MSRGLAAQELSAVTASHRAIAPCIEALFDSGALRLTLAPWDLTFGGNTYIAAGALINVREAREATGSVEGLEFSLTGLDPAILTIATQEPYRGRVIRLQKGIFNTATNTLIANPRTWFLGRMKSMVITETNNSCTVTVVAEHYEAALGRPSPLRLNDADQQRMYPGDRGCEWVEAMTERNIVWPAREALMR
ncbi:MAG TPA: hypothetical protein VGD45_20700 [Steroidobacter sp.]|uniref:hypothetical protein n=1 Tax=Steroidobacter sp. TaxID=1978227 RepID=UPI002ED79CDF